MLVKLFLVILYLFAIVLGCLNGLNLLKRKETGIKNIFIEFIKIILPIFALISLFFSLDYNSFWFIVYISIYYVLEAIYNLLENISLQDANKVKFYPKVFGQKTNKMMSAFTIVYALPFHLLLHNTIINWFSHSVFLNVISIIGLVLLLIFSLPSIIIVFFDFYTIIEIPIYNAFINKTVKNIKKLTYIKLLKKLKVIDKFIYAYKPEIDTQFSIKKVISTLQFKYSKDELSNTMSKDDQEFIIGLLSKFQDSYIK